MKIIKTITLTLVLSTGVSAHAYHWKKAGLGILKISTGCFILGNACGIPIENLTKARWWHLNGTQQENEKVKSNLRVTQFTAGVTGLYLIINGFQNIFQGKTEYQKPQEEVSSEDAITNENTENTIV